jgi:hypothetical protein
VEEEKLEDVDKIECLFEYKGYEGPLDKEYFLQDYDFNTLNAVRREIQEDILDWCDREDTDLNQVINGIECLKEGQTVNQVILLEQNKDCNSDKILLGKTRTLNECIDLCD